MILPADKRQKEVTKSRKRSNVVCAALYMEIALALSMIYYCCFKMPYPGAKPL